MLPDEVSSKITGDYERIRVLGSGGMGRVYLARHRFTQTIVALKILFKKRIREKETLHRFLREAGIVQGLAHPNIVSLYEASAGANGAAPFIAMEYVDGTSLAASRSLTAEPEAVLSYASQAADALAAVHRQNIVHRDIKPGNIMIRSDGKLKLLDFGLARLLAQPLKATSATMFQTRRGSLLGTVKYMSPECARGNEAHFPTDIFSLGIVLYELATGFHPFEAETEAKMLEAIRSETPVRPRRINPNISSAFANLITSMLEKDVSHRPCASEIVYEVTRCLGAGGGVAARQAKSSEPSFVGRNAERDAIAECFQRAAGGKGSLLCISGEAGFGKTTLAEDSLARASGFRLARGRCSERFNTSGEISIAGSEAYLPILESIQRLLLEESGETVARVLATLAPSWHARIVRNPDTRIPSADLLKMEYLAFLQQLAEDRPLILFLDDLHWADVSTVDLLNYMAARIGGTRAVILATYRASDLALGKHPFAKVKAELSAHHLCREVSLGSLTVCEIGSYIDSEYPNHRFPVGFADAIFRATGGTPLFMAEILRYLRGRGAIAREAGFWRLTQSLTKITQDMPGTTAEVIERKISRLSERDHAVLQAAAAQGMEFDSAVLAEALAKPAEEIEDALIDLDRYHRFVSLVRDREFPDRTPTRTYTFVHVLYQEALLRQLTQTRLIRLSARIADVLRRMHDTDAWAIAAQLAFLYSTAREPEKAVEFFTIAAGISWRFAAHREASDLARRGMEMLDRLPPGPERDRRQLSLCMLLGASLMATRTYADSEVEQTWARAGELIGDRETAPQYFEIRLAQWASNIMRARLDTACRLAEDLIRFAERAEGEKRNILLSGACMAHGLTLTQMGRFSLSTARFEEAIRHHASVRVHGPPLFPLHPGAASRAQMALNLWYLGHPDRAVAVGMEGIEKAGEAADSYSQAFALMYCAGVHQLRGEPEIVRDLASQAMMIADKPEHRYSEVFRWSSSRHGWAVAKLGNSSEGIAEMRESLAANHASGSVAARAHFLSLMAAVLLQFDYCGEAFEVVEETLATIAATGSRFYLSEVLRLKGELLLRRGKSNLALAQSSFQEGLSVAREQKCRGFELRLLISLVRLKNQGARSELDLALGLYTEGLQTQDLLDARAALETA